MWGLWILLLSCKILGLRFRGSGLQLYIQMARNIEFRGLLHLFRALDVEKSRNIFLNFVTIPTLPFSRLLINQLEGSDYDRMVSLLRIDKILDASRCKQFNLTLFFTQFLRLLSDIPFSIKTGAHANVVNETREHVTEAGLLNIRNVCKHILEHESNITEYWTLIDGEFISEADRPSYSAIVDAIIGPRHLNDITLLNGIGPAIRVQQTLVAIEYMKTLGKITKEQKLQPFLNVLSLNLSEAGALKHLTAEQEKEHLVYLHLRNESLMLLRAKIRNLDSHPIADHWLVYFNMMWIHLQTMLPDTGENVMRVHGMFDCLSLAISWKYGERFLASTRIAYLLCLPRDHVLGRDLYTLMIMLMSSKEEGLRLEVDAVWQRLVQHYATDIEILTLVPEHFALIASLGSAEASREAFRLHLSFHSRTLFDSNIFSELQVTFELENILNTNFILVQRDDQKHSVLIPKLEIHPFVELRLVTLLCMAVLLRIQLPIRLHDVYFRWLFAFREAFDFTRPLLTRELITIIIRYQFMTSDYEATLDRLGSLSHFETLHSKVKKDPSRNLASEQEHSKFLSKSKNGKGFLPLIWGMAGNYEEMGSILERMGMDVWSAKALYKSESFPIADMHDINDSQRFFFAN